MGKLENLARRTDQWERKIIERFEKWDKAVRPHYQTAKRFVERSRRPARRIGNGIVALSAVATGFTVGTLWLISGISDVAKATDTTYYISAIATHAVPLTFWYLLMGSAVLSSIFVLVAFYSILNVTYIALKWSTRHLINLNPNWRVHQP